MAEDQTKSCGMAESLLARYADFDLSECEEIEVEKHLVNCADCAEQIQRMRAYAHSWAVLSPEFPALVRRLTTLRAATLAQAGAAPVPSHASVQAPSVGHSSSLSPDLLSAIMRGLEVATRKADRSRDQEKVSRFRSWGRLLDTNIQRAVEKLSTAGTSVQSFQKAQMDVLREIGWAWLQRIEPLAAAGLAGPVREAPSGFRTRGAPAESIGSFHGVEIRLEPVPGSKDVEVVAEGLPVNSDRLIALLVPKDAPDKTQEAVLRRISDNTWIARFENVAPGDHAVAIEPLSNKTVE